MILYDAHNHLQDPRLDGVRDELLAEVAAQPIARMVVNGTREADWPRVLDLARAHPIVLPSFGAHPWHVQSLGPDWKYKLELHWEAAPSAVGEIGLDRWVEGHDLPRQEAVFQWQWDWAATRNRPVSIHCLKAWGRLEERLRNSRRPERGFLLHSYGGPAEMIPSFAAMGAYFSLSGYFAHDRKSRQRDVFRRVPPDRLLIETDAPDMRPPPALDPCQLKDAASGEPLNHPANLPSVYAFAAGLVGCPLAELAEQVRQNFTRLFAGL